VKEEQVLFQISQIAGAATDFDRALESIRVLLERTFGAKALTVDLRQTSRQADLTTAHVEQVLEAFDLPYRSLYSVPLRAGGNELGKLIVCYASQEFHGTAPQRVSQYTGEQLGMLLERTRLHDNRKRLGGALVSLREELATRKVLERAQGILTARRGMALPAARLWISQEARRSGLPRRAIADRIIQHQIDERAAELAPRPRRIA